MPPRPSTTKMQSIYAPRPCRLLSVTDLTPQEKLFRLQLSDGSDLDHLPGQFVQVSVPGLTEAPISVASSPDRHGFFDLGIRRAGRLTTALHALPPGAQLGIRGPFGRPFHLEALTGKDLLLIAGGCGLAPLRSLLQYCEDHRDRFGVLHLLYGARSPADLMFKEDLHDWQKGACFNCRVTVDHSPADGCYDGATGLVTGLLDDLDLVPGRTVAVLVGPPPMYRPLLDTLGRKGIAKASIMLSLERMMRCGIGKCGHCSIEHLLCCQDGPVFWLPEIEHLRGAL
jgi:sulfhydrogenase subunit gamma (sulfur reductase)